MPGRFVANLSDTPESPEGGLDWRCQSEININKHKASYLVRLSQAALQAPVSGSQPSLPCRAWLSSGDDSQPQDSARLVKPMPQLSRDMAVYIPKVKVSNYCVGSRYHTVTATRKTRSVSLR
ncbi:hypothetical protein RRG08_021050 [Elysia crispata]|uniref:Uncharacterized protein n=1 Tax=Elysia crispata TaxID=231223 RepID=A0AAE0YZQ8_9GAST|nr:hypothetical protein RRG08_021050 [Elysia crispata]